MDVELNDRGTQQDGSSRSGDIILVMDVAAGFLTCIHGDEYPGWHGGPTAAEGRVPLLFRFLGAHDAFVSDALQTVPVRNWDLTAKIANIIKSTKSTGQ